MAWPARTRCHNYRRVLYNFTLPNAQSFISLATYIIVRSYRCISCDYLHDYILDYLCSIIPWVCSINRSNNSKLYYGTYLYRIDASFK